MNFSAKYWSVHAYDETVQSQENELMSGADVTILKVNIRLGIVPVPTSQNRTPRNSLGIVSSAQKYFV